VFVTVGTDDHPFDRLIEWVDRWRATDLGRTVELTVQYGVSRPPRDADADAHALMSYDDLRTAMRRATVVVSHAGGGRIMLARQAGVVPLVVARRPDLAEAGDDRQEHLARRLSTLGYCDAVGTEEELHQRLNDAVTGRRRSRVDRTGGVDPAMRFAGLVDAMFADGPA
jgi:UDP-N-acetylglucosamine transferase subunit ALG13